MLSSLVKTYEKNFMETITVIHSVSKSKPQIVATVEADKNLTDKEKCELAFRLTNSISEAWYMRDDVNYLGSTKTCRSTSLNDFILIGSNKYKCTSRGWKLV